MPRFEITGPDGHKYEITGPEGATEAEALAKVKAQVASATPPKKDITQADRVAYTEALPGTPEGAKTRAEIESRYGGREVFREAWDPFGKFMDEKVVPPLLIGGALMAGPEIAAAAGAPMIARTLLPRALAAGGQPGVVEPAAGAGVKAAGQAIGKGAQAVAGHPLTKEALRWLGAYEIAKAAGLMGGGGKP